MLQWLGPKYDKEIIYNDLVDGRYCSVILNIETLEKRIIRFPVYSVSSDGKFALSLDFSRLYNLRPGYGYYNVEEETKNIDLPDKTCIWKIDIKSGKVTELLKYTDFANFEPRKEMLEINSVHKVNHIMISPNGKRFMVLYRWFVGERKYTRLITCDIDGKNMYVLNDDDMVSHCYWKNDEEILAFENKHKYGTGYYLMKDKTNHYKQCWKDIKNDGHPSYSPNGKYVVIDSYPSRTRMQSIKICNNDDEYKEIAQVFSPFKYDNDTRCDLHPRWDRNSNKICFDSVFEGKRELYMIDISDNKKHSILKDDKKNGKKGLVSCIIPTYKRSDTLTRAIDSALNQTYQNIEILVVDDNEPNSDFSKEVEKKLLKYKNDQRVRYVKKERHINGAVARNVGVKEANGEYIAFLDDDDEWENDKLEKQVRKIETEKLDIVTCLWKQYRNNEMVHKCQEYNANNIQLKIFSREVAVYTSTVLIRRVTILKFGGFDETLLRHQDLQFLVEATSVAKFNVINEYLVKLHNDSDINRPDVKKLILYKKAFFNSTKDYFEKYDKKTKKEIKNAHYFEVVYAAVKEKKFATAFKYFLKTGLRISSLKKVLLRYKNRKNN